MLSLILRIGRAYGLRAMRLPLENGAPLLLRPWLALLRWRLRAAGVAHNDYVVGIANSGGMDETVLLDALRWLPPGVGEIYLHPGVESGARVTQSMAGYRHADELAAPVVAARACRDGRSGATARQLCRRVRRPGARLKQR